MLSSRTACKFIVQSVKCSDKQYKGKCGILTGLVEYQVPCVILTVIHHKFFWHIALYTCTL